MKRLEVIAPACIVDPWVEVCALSALCALRFPFEQGGHGPGVVAQRICIIAAGIELAHVRPRPSALDSETARLSFGILLAQVLLSGSG